MYFIRLATGLPKMLYCTFHFSFIHSWVNEQITYYQILFSNSSLIFNLEKADHRCDACLWKSFCPRQNDQIGQFIALWEAF